MCIVLELSVTYRKHYHAGWMISLGVDAFAIDNHSIRLGLAVRLAATHNGGRCRARVKRSERVVLLLMVEFQCDRTWHATGYMFAWLH